MNTLQTNKGIPFYQWPTENPESKGILLYLCGGGGKPENPLYSTFAKEFVVKHQDKFQCFAGALPAGQTGWDFPMKDGTDDIASEHLANFIKNNFPYNGNYTYSGWSAGSSVSGMFKCSDFVTTFVLCAGGGDYTTFTNLGKKNIPARWYHAADDGPIPFSTAESRAKTYGPAMQLIKIASGGHSAAPNTAFDTNSDLATWVLSKSKPVEPPINPVSDYPAKKIYLSNGVIKFEFENGETKTVKPDD